MLAWSFTIRSTHSSYWDTFRSNIRHVRFNLEFNYFWKSRNAPTFDRIEMTAGSVILMQSIRESCTQSDLSTTPAICRLKLISSSEGIL